jgi:hypothetical protein
VDSHIRCLIVVTSAPIADTTRDNTSVAISNAGEFDQVNSRWSAHEVDQEHMLTYLFDWKVGGFINIKKKKTKKKRLV